MNDTSSPRLSSSPSNVVSINDKRAAYVVMTNVEVTRTILGTLGTTAYGVYAFLDTYCNTEQKAWVSVPTIASGVRLSERQVQRILRDLERGGWIAREERTNQFGFVNGITFFLKHHTTPSDKTGDKGGDKPPVENVTQGNKKVTPKVKENPPTPLPEHGPAQQIVKVWCEEVGLERPTDYRRAVGQAQHLVKAGLTPDDARDLIQWIRQQAWVTSSLDLGLMYKLADKWRTDPKRVAAAPKRELTQDELRQKQYIDWKPGTFQNLNEWYDRRDNGTLPVKGLLR